MVENSTRLSNISHNNIMLFDVAVRMSFAYRDNKIQKRRERRDYQIPIFNLKERPGRQRILYSAIFD